MQGGYDAHHNTDCNHGNRPSRVLDWFGEIETEGGRYWVQNFFSKIWPMTPVLMGAESCQKSSQTFTFSATFFVYAPYGSKKLLKKIGNFLIRQKCRDLGRKFANFLRWKSAREKLSGGTRANPRQTLTTRRLLNHRRICMH